MIRLQFRLRPVRSLADLDLDVVEAALRSVPGVERIDMFDDVASDATFITAVVLLERPSSSTFRALRDRLHDLPRMSPTIVDGSGNEVRATPDGSEWEALREHAVVVTKAESPSAGPRPSDDPRRR